MLEGSGRLSEEATDTSPRGAEAGGRMGGRIAEELLIGKKKAVEILSYHFYSYKINGHGPAIEKFQKKKLIIIRRPRFF